MHFASFVEYFDAKQFQRFIVVLKSNDNSQKHPITTIQVLKFIHSLISTLWSPSDKLDSAFDRLGASNDACEVAFCFWVSGLANFTIIFIFVLHNFVVEDVAIRLHQKYSHVCQWKMHKNPNRLFEIKIM